MNIEYEVSADHAVPSSRLKDIWNYRELLFLLIKRDFISGYKQTVLGPLWFIIQPVMTALIFSFVFGRIARLPTDSLPPFIFYMSGTIVWGFFANCVTKTSYTFIGNTALFQKVYFPRMVVPLSLIVTNLLNFLVQLLILIVFMIIFAFRGAPIDPNYKIIIIPAILLQIILLGLGLGCMISSWTVKYRDLNMAVGFGMQLWMYASCVFFPRSMVPDQYQWLLTLNPMVSIIECFRYTLLGVGQVEIYQWLISVAITLFIAITGLWMFRRSEGSFTDNI